MIVLDPDVIRWGLHTLIDTCCIPISGSSQNCGVMRYEPAESCPVGYVREVYCEAEAATCVNSVENDAVIARALQEEYSRVAAAQASGVRNPGQETILAQDWPEKGLYSGSRMVSRVDDENCGRNREGDCSRAKTEDADDVSVSAGEEQSHDIEIEEILQILETADESARDGEVGRRLNQMVSVPHFPKTNGEIPSEDEETSDHQRLLERLKVYQLIENKVQGDGNCQFRAISDQLYRSPEHHKFVREQVIKQLKSHRQIYGGYVPMAYSNYLKKMSKSGEWGDHVTLQAAADSYGIKIFVITSFKDTCYIEILPQEQKSDRVIFLSFWAEVHYNSIYPGELPLPETKKKRWWSILTS